MTTKEAVMTTQEVADRLYELFQQGNWHQAQEELFSNDAKSIEPPNSPGMVSVEGLDNIKRKEKCLAKWWKKCTGVIPENRSLQEILLPLPWEWMQP